MNRAIVMFVFFVVIAGCATQDSPEPAASSSDASIDQSSGGTSALSRQGSITDSDATRAKVAFREGLAAIPSPTCRGGQVYLDDEFLGTFQLSSDGKTEVGHISLRPRPEYPELPSGDVQVSVSSGGSVVFGPVGNAHIGHVRHGAPDTTMAGFAKYFESVTPERLFDADDPNLEIIRISPTIWGSKTPATNYFVKNRVGQGNFTITNSPKELVAIEGFTLWPPTSGPVGAAGFDGMRIRGTFQCAELLSGQRQWDWRPEATRALQLAYDVKVEEMIDRQTTSMVFVNNARASPRELTIAVSEDGDISKCSNWHPFTLSDGNVTEGKFNFTFIDADGNRLVTAGDRVDVAHPAATRPAFCLRAEGVGYLVPG